MRDFLTAEGWIQTWSGHPFWVAHPSAEDIFIEDIANALSQQCRYGGHTRRMYSVAEHCCHVHDASSASNKLAALMHDAGEAYLLDVPRPLKSLLVGYQEIESGLMAVIATKYGFAWPLPEEVKYLDTEIIADERAQAMAPSVDGFWNKQPSTLDVVIKFWSPSEAASEFLTRFGALCP